MTAHLMGKINLLAIIIEANAKNHMLTGDLTRALHTYIKRAVCSSIHRRSATAVASINLHSNNGRHISNDP